MGPRVGTHTIGRHLGFICVTMGAQLSRNAAAVCDP